MIGNPPYVTYKGKQIVNISDKLLNQLIQSYPNSAEYKVNSYALFVECGLKLINNKGILSFIIPSTILQNEYLKKIRKFIITKYHISKIVSFANKVFEATTDSIILFLNNLQRLKETVAIRKNDLNFSVFENVKSYNQSNWDNSTDYVINLKTDHFETNLLEKIDKGNLFIEDYFEVYVGIVAKGIKKFLSSVPIDSNHKKYLQGKHINKNKISFDSLYINFIKEELHSNTDENVYLQSEKILVRKTGNKLIAVIDDNQYYTDQSIYNLYLKKDKKIDLKFVTGILNSRVLDWYFNKKMITNPDVFPYIKGIHLKKLPIPNISLSAQQPLITLVNQILSAKKENSTADTSALEREIDLLVYGLYGLTAGEVGVIEGE